ncbi:MAG TPA: hypothetical protein VIR16_10590 [Candidatus Limnocylindrales bacterium]
MTHGAASPAPEEAAVPSAGSGVSGRVIAIVIVVAVVAAAVVGRAWLDLGGARALPGTPLAIQTDAPAPSAAACGTTGLPPARLAVSDGSLVLLRASDGAEISVAWPAGYAARLDQGHGALYDPTGYLVATAGEPIQERFFGTASGDGTFHVCRVAGD